MGSSNDVSRTVDDGHTLLHVILHLELVDFSFSECAISPEKRTASEPNTAPQAVCVGEHVGSEVQPRRPPCCRFMARLSVHDSSQSTVEVSVIFSITSSVATRIALSLRAARLFKKLALRNCKAV